MFEIKDRFFVAKKAGCFDLFDGICQLTEPLTAFKQMCPKISAQTITNHRYIEISSNNTQIINVLSCQELNFIHQNTLNVFGFALLLNICK